MYHDIDRLIQRSKEKKNLLIKANMQIHVLFKYSLIFTIKFVSCRVLQG